MKKLLLFLTLLAETITVQADDYPYLTFETNDGKKVSVGIQSNNLSMTFTSTTLNVGNQKTFNLKDLKKMYFSTYDHTTGIEEVNADDVTVYGYYDLQGRPVQQPLKGIYIIKTSKGNKKVFVK